MKPRYAIALLALGLLLLGHLFSATESSPVTTETAFQAPVGLVVTSLPSAVQASTVTEVKKACYCTCTAEDGEPSGGQVFAHPGGGSSCSSYNGDGCNIGGENGTLSHCRSGPVPIGTELLPPM